MHVKDIPSMSVELAAKILTLVNECGLKQHQAAALLGLNQGRVSEVVNGKTFAGTEPVPRHQLSFDL